MSTPTANWQRITVLLLVLALLVCCFFDAMFRNGLFAFRDAAHFYYPLLKFVQDQWAAGRVPLWNPYENLGQPLAANAPSSVFYPGKLIFLLPVSYAWAYKLYILGHVLLAAATAYRLARHAGTSVAAAGCCALSYAFCGNVLMQYCNVVFLVGAAWLPLALLFADRMLEKGRDGMRLRFSSALCFGIVLAMMTLGGDVQMAYNAGLLAAIYALLLWWQQRGYVRSTNAENPPGCHAHACVGMPGTAKNMPTQAWAWHPIRELRIDKILAARPTVLAVAAAAAFVLSAIQVIPSMEFARRSNRAATAEVDWLGHIENGTHGEHAYHFSVGPWRLAEYVWPNVAGRQYPVHRRWLEVVPAEGRIWTPTLYMGVIPLLLALSAMRFRLRPNEKSDEPAQPPPAASRDTWLTWSVVLAVLASFGYYGLGWILLEIHCAGGGDPHTFTLCGAPLGGLYWLMNHVLPGYLYFRYPAKLLVVAAVGLSVLAARGWDRAFTGQATRLRKATAGLAAVSLLAALAAVGVRPWWHEWMAGVRDNVLFGPLDAAGAWWDLFLAFVQTAAVCGLFWWLLPTTEKRPRTDNRKAWAAVATLVLVAVDLGMANRWLITCAPQTLWQTPSRMATAIREHEADKHEQIVRVYRHPLWTREAWAKSGYRRRLAETVAWDRNTLWPKYNLQVPLATTEVSGTMMLEDYRHFLFFGSDVPGLPGNDASDNEPRPAATVSHYAILPGDKTLPCGIRLNTDVPDATVWFNTSCLPRVWLIRDGRAIVQPETRQHWTIAHDEPDRVVIDVMLRRPATVVLSDQYYPGWQLTVNTDNDPPQSLPIRRVNRVMRGVDLPAGHHRLTYVYRPTSFYAGAAISAVGWLALIGTILVRRRFSPLPRGERGRG